MQLDDGTRSQLALMTYFQDLTAKQNKPVREAFTKVVRLFPASHFVSQNFQTFQKGHDTYS